MQFLPDRKRCFITETNRLMLFGEIIFLCSENSTRHTCTVCGKSDECFCVMASGIVGPANQNGCIILRVGNLADEKL
jgi:hypothetical protein